MCAELLTGTRRSWTIIYLSLSPPLSKVDTVLLKDPFLTHDYLVGQVIVPLLEM